ncbi:hypothetical protein WJX72_002367 [[Myrmecia] bisecta]|uniref:hydroxyacylglutathione hydrolase n=1 Tax=[Myrmecia] bisecta TaxID=41462 RepID=A0AAW1PSI5_9CHLO
MALSRTSVRLVRALAQPRSAVAGIQSRSSPHAPPAAAQLTSPPQRAAFLSCRAAQAPVTLAKRTARFHIAAQAVSADKALQERRASHSGAGTLMESSTDDEGDQWTDPKLIMEVIRIPCLTDNYVWLLVDKNSGKVAVVDPSEAAPVIQALKDRQLELDFILNTHHHHDHTGGNLELKRKYKCVIAGPGADRDRIPGIDYPLVEDDVFMFGDIKTHVYNTPGHTHGHITLWMPEALSLFPGDTLFALGCGRLFEGTPEQMWHSLQKLLKLPREALVYCAHEYTQSNARFAVMVDPDNPKLRRRKEEIDELRAQGRPTVPSILGDEFDTNPFLRPWDPAIRKHLGVPPDAPDEVAFAALRRAKDNF